MPGKSSFDYAVVRVVPRIDREEFVNAGVILYCLSQSYLDAKVELSAERLRALASDIDLALVNSHLQTIPRICIGGSEAGDIGRMSQKERWHWLVSPKSALIQTSPVHSGLCDSPQEMLEKLMEQLVRV